MQELQMNFNLVHPEEYSLEQLGVKCPFRLIDCQITN